jgi:hypothetical protein
LLLKTFIQIDIFRRKIGNIYDPFYGHFILMAYLPQVFFKRHRSTLLKLTKNAGKLRGKLRGKRRRKAVLNRNVIREINALFCSNMDGSKRFNPVLIADSENPRCFNHK